MSRKPTGQRRHGLSRRPLPDLCVTPPEREMIRRQGIKRQPERHPAATMPVSPRQQHVLDGLDRVPRGQKEIAMRVGLSPRQVSSALYALQARGLVERPVPGGGWWRT